MTAPHKTDDPQKAETADVREHFSRDKPLNGEAGESYGDEKDSKDERMQPKTPNGKGLANEHYVKSDSDQPRIAEEPGSLSGRS